MAVPGTLSPFMDPLEAMVDGTLFKAEYDSGAASYLVVSRTPVEDNDPLVLKVLISRGDATRFRERNWTKGHSINTAALQLGMDELQPKIAEELRRFKNGIVVQRELETIEGFASF